MEIVLGAFAALLLLVAMVYLLHRHNQVETRQLADRSAPLPPLHGATLRSSPETPSDTTDVPFRTETSVATTPAAPTPESAMEDDENSSGGSWYDEVAELKRRGALDAALRICHSAFPLWSAFQQATLIRRAQIKARLTARQEYISELRDLYHLAAVAELLHGRAKAEESLSLTQLKMLNMNDILALDMPYPEIGFVHLRLIKKTDIKLLQDVWGKPNQQRSPRVVHEAMWRQLMTRVSPSE